MNREVISYLSLGSNMGDKLEYLRSAHRELARAEKIEIRRMSPVYQTEPVGKTDQDWFLNQVMEIATTLPPPALLETCQSIEQRLGRVRLERWGPRTMDIDILLYGDVKQDDPQLTLPHPRMLERAFVLVPLADLVPELVIDKRTVAEHLARLSEKDRAGVVLYVSE